MGQEFSKNFKTVIFWKNLQAAKGVGWTEKERNLNQDNQMAPFRVGAKYYKKLNEDGQRRKGKAGNVTRDMHIKQVNTHELFTTQMVTVRGGFIVKSEGRILL